VSHTGIVNGGGQYNIIENNYLVKCRFAHSSDRRAQQKHHTEDMYRQLDMLNYKRPPWSDSFPELSNMSKMRTIFFELLNTEWVGGVIEKYTSVHISPLYYSDLDPNGCVFSKNIIFKNKDCLVNSRILNKHRYSSFDFYTIKNNLLEINPKFVDEDNLNFDLQDDSPAYNLSGFTRIPFEKIGVLHD
jgi:hypothetical protein